MIETLLMILVLLALAGLFVFLLVRALRPRRSILKFIGAFFAGLLALLAGALAVVALIGFFQLYFPRVPEVAEISVEGTPQQIERGRHIAEFVCADCHSPDRSLPLAGGADLFAGSPMPMGTAPGYNLTPAGPLAAWSDTDLFRAIRFNVDPDGRRLMAMSVTAVGNLSDEDTRAVIAYLRSQPPVGDETRQEKLTPVAALITGAGMLPFQARAESVAHVQPSETAGYGKYLVDFAGCRDCHGMDLKGGAGGFTPAGPNLTSVTGWSKEQFIQAIRTGERPFSPPIDPQQMPWPVYSRMDDLELGAIYAYLSGLK